MQHKRELQYSSMICVATKDSSRTKYEIKKEGTTRGFLTKGEIRMLMDGKPKNAKQELYRDLYLFCAFHEVVVFRYAQSA